MPLSSTLAALTPDMLAAYYAPPLPAPFDAFASTDVATFMSSNYLKGLDKNIFQNQLVDQPNKNAFARYKLACANWVAQPAKVLPLPTPPVYLAFDNAGFDTWWTTFTSNGGDAPKADFVKEIAPLAPPVILDPLPPPVLVAGANPIGVSDGGGVYFDAPGDVNADGTIYKDATGVYVKHIYTTPFGITNFWFKLS